jgi:hypothetical protein
MDALQPLVTPTPAAVTDRRIGVTAAPFIKGGPATVDLAVRADRLGT